MDELLTRAMQNWVGILMWIVGSLTIIPVLFYSMYSFMARKFTDQLNFSVNFLEDDHLLFRTLKEVPIADVFGMYIRFKLMWYILFRRNKDNPIIILDSKTMDGVMRKLINYLSDSFQEGTIARTKGRANVYDFRMALTCERAGGIDYKFRLMLIEPDLLIQIGTQDMPRFANEVHNKLRRSTLAHMHEAAQAHPKSVGRIEIAIKP